MKMEFIPKVVQAVAGEGYTVYAYFEDGVIKLIDVSKNIEKGGVFLPLKDLELFRSRLTVMGDTVAWDMTGDRDMTACVDLDPIVIYENGKTVTDPLEKAV